jgi:hypothetical protein
MVEPSKSGACHLTVPLVLGVELFIVIPDDESVGIARPKSARQALSDVVIKTFALSKWFSTRLESVYA